MPHDTLSPPKPPATPAPAGAGRQSKRLTLLLVALTGPTLILDLTITNVALPTIQRALRMSPPALQWVVNAYALGYGGFLLLGGRLADRLGRRRVFVAGVAVFTLASLLGGLAPTGAALIAARGLQGLGAALAGPAGLSILTTTFREGPERNHALGVRSAVLASNGALGMLAGATAGAPAIGDLRSDPSSRVSAATGSGRSGGGRTFGPDRSGSPDPETRWRPDARRPCVGHS
jgi:MFS family permease